MGSEVVDQMCSVGVVVAVWIRRRPGVVGCQTRVWMLEWWIRRLVACGVVVVSDQM